MNLPTILTISILAVAVVAVIAVWIRNKKQGKHSCSCGGGCGSCNICHQNKQH